MEEAGSLAGGPGQGPAVCWRLLCRFGTRTFPPGSYLDVTVRQSRVFLGVGLPLLGHFLSLNSALGLPVPSWRSWVQVEGLCVAGSSPAKAREGQLEISG